MNSNSTPIRLQLPDSKGWNAMEALVRQGLGHFRTTPAYSGPIPDMPPGDGRRPA